MKGIVSKTVVFALLITALFCVPATADITLPWDKPGNYGTYQEWNFNTDQTPYVGIPADVDLNPYGTPTATIGAIGEPGVPADGPRFVAAYGSRTGLVYASPIMDLDLWIPNAPAPLQKWVQVEIEYFCQPGGGYIPGTAFADPDNGPSVGPVSVTERQDADLVRYLTLLFTFPQSETRLGELVGLWLHDSGVYVDKIEVATICVPIPGAILLGMLGLGYAGMRLRKYS